MQYVAFDVETPRRLNDRICSIGISTLNEDGTIQTKKFLVNPECDFDDYNISLTGICPSDVENYPCFSAVWEEIEGLFVNSILVAHNATFDLSVLQKTLSFYSLSSPIVRYLCTFKIAKNELQVVENYKLPTLCAYYGIPLSNHDAGSDSEACAKLLIHFIEQGIPVSDYMSVYDLSHAAEKSVYPMHRRSSHSALALNELNAIVKDISSDGILEKDEIEYLVSWMSENSDLKGNYPYDRIYNKLTEVLEDGVVTPQEHEELLQLFKSADDPVNDVASSCCGQDISGKTICLSGEFYYGQKDKVSALLSEKGAIVLPSVSKKTNI